MKIGIISETYGRPTPPVGYGGIAATIHDISEELVRRGHEVVLFATEGSWTSGRLVLIPGGDVPLRQKVVPEYVLFLAANYINGFDVWIDGSHHKRFARYCMEHYPEENVLCPAWNPNSEDSPCNTVVQSPHMVDKQLLNKPDNTPFFFAAIPLWEYEPSYEPGDGGVSINVLSEYKGTDLLVASAARHGFPLKLYGPISSDSWYKASGVQDKVERYSNIRYMGECGPERIDILRNATASFTLSVWPEPGSRVSLESFACGCPVIALECGCFPYYIESGVNGVLCKSRDPDTIYEAYLEVESAGRRMREAARKTAEEKFNLGVYVDNWENLFQRMIRGERWA